MKLYNIEYERKLSNVEPMLMIYEYKISNVFVNPPLKLGHREPQLRLFIHAMSGSDC